MKTPPLKVLVIEDHYDLLDNTAELLELEGYEVYKASEGLEGFELMKSVQPDIVLCDVTMPKTNGLDFLSLAKKTPSTASIPLIFLSAGSAPPDVQRGVKNGADLYLSKPYLSDELLEAVKKMTAR